MNFSSRSEKHSSALTPGYKSAYSGVADAVKSQGMHDKKRPRLESGGGASMLRT